jgi:hypothetical protein
MGKIKVDVCKNTDGNVYLEQNNQVVTSITIKGDKDLEIGIGNGFGAAAQVDSLTLYNLSGGGKGTAIGTWSRSNPSSQPSTYVSISGDGNGILVEDTNTVADQDVFFSVTATDNGQSYDTDPELIIKKKG